MSDAGTGGACGERAPQFLGAGELTPEGEGGDAQSRRDRAQRGGSRRQLLHRGRIDLNSPHRTAYLSFEPAEKIGAGPNRYASGIFLDPAPSIPQENTFIRGGTHSPIQHLLVRRSTKPVPPRN